MRLAAAQPLISAIQLVKLEIHGAATVPAPVSPFSRPPHYSVGFSRRIKHLSPHLCLRVPVLNSRQKRNEISALSPELGLRDIPGYSAKWSRHDDVGIAAGIARVLPLVEATGGEVVAVARSPLRLQRRVTKTTACRRARALPIAYAVIRLEPPATFGARPLLRHASIVIDAGPPKPVDCFWRADPGCFSRASTIRNAASALAPGGSLVVIDCLSDGSATDNNGAAVYALHLGMRTAKGRVYSAQEVGALCAAAGLSRQETHLLSNAMLPLRALIAQR